MNTPNLTEINDKLDAILELLQRNKKRSTSADDPRKNLNPERVAELERLFWTLANAERPKRKGSYRAPADLLEDGKATHAIQAVIVSVLVNQATLRKVFQRKGANDPAGESPAECARRILKKTALVVVPINAAFFGSSRDTEIALSPFQAEKSLKDSSYLPTEWKKWSCEERALPFKNVIGQKFPPTPCPSDAGAVPRLRWNDSLVDDSPAPAKVPTRVEVEDEYFDDEDDETTPVIKPSSRLDFSSLGDSTPPADYYKTRVQFVEEDEG